VLALVLSLWAGPIKLTEDGPAQSSHTVGFLLRTPRPAKQVGKMDFAKSQFEEPCVNLFKINPQKRQWKSTPLSNTKIR
jgi:hypothetical protein